MPQIEAITPEVLKIVEVVVDRWYHTHLDPHALLDSVESLLPRANGKALVLPDSVDDLICIAIVVYAVCVAIVVYAGAYKKGRYGNGK